jgi:hypothetical protein
MQIGKGKQGVILEEYGDNGSGFLGCIFPACDNNQWIMWFDSKGNAQLYTERETGKEHNGAVVGEPIKLKAREPHRTKSQREIERLKEEIAQLDTQMAGCLTAAEGWSCDEHAKKGDYGWSPAYQAVLELRKKYDGLLLLKSSLPKITLQSESVV